MKKHFFRLLTLCLAYCMLTACGQAGRLYMPDQAPQPPTNTEKA